ncbi:MAG: sulfatase [Rhodothermales bacterium]
MKTLFDDASSIFWTIIFILVAAASGCQQNTPDSSPAKPNIVMILSDDHGFDDAGAYGNTAIHTPNIDRLASEGLKFTRMYTTSAMCTPSRSALYTGLYPHRNGAYQNHSAVSPGIESMPHHLQKLGYRIALLGKRHIKPLAQFPFEFLETDSLDSFISDPTPYVLLITPDEPHAPASMVFEASKRYNPQTIPLPPYLIDTPETRDQRTGYYDLVEILDNKVGHVINTLAAAEQFDTTLFIYTSDHGAGFPFEKWTCYEAGIKIPFVARWPGKIKMGTTTDAMASLIDVLPTFIEIAGGMSPDSLDGQSFLGVLQGQSDHHRDLIFSTHTTTGIIEGSYYPIRSVRDQRYKYIRNLNAEGLFTNLITNRTGQGGWNSWKVLAASNEQAMNRTEIYQKRPAEELYDLHLDPYELNNLAQEPEYQDIKTTLNQSLQDWMYAVGDQEVENN